jgi:hypothetical protein
LLRGLRALTERPRADDRKKIGKPDRDRVNVDELYELRGLG